MALLTLLLLQFHSLPVRQFLVKNAARNFPGEPNNSLWFQEINRLSDGKTAVATATGRGDHLHDSLNSTTSRSRIVKNERESRRMKESSSRGLIYVLKYTEQLESALYDLWQMANLAAQWDLRLVEPFVYKSFYMLPPFIFSYQDPQVLSFSDIYNFTAVQKNFKSYLKVDYDVLATQDELYKAHFDQIVVVDICKGGKHCVESLKTHAGFNYFLQILKIKFASTNSQYFQGVSKETSLTGSHNGNQTGFSGFVQVVCVDGSNRIKFKTLLDSVLRSGTNSKPLVVFTSWNGVRSYSPKFFYTDPDFLKNQKTYSSIHSLPPSTSVKRAAKIFGETLRLSRPLLTIHIRMERLLADGGFEHVAECVKELEKTIERLKIEKGLAGNSGGMVVARDYGHEGSYTCVRKKCSSLAKALNIDKRLKKLGAVIAEYDPTDYDKLPQPDSPSRQTGFASMVEKELLASGDYLVTVGWGSFQTSVVKRFLTDTKHEAKNLITTICQKM